MKTFLLVLFALLSSSAPGAVAQTASVKPHRVVMQINVDAGESWNQLLGNIANIQRAFGAEKVEIEVVAYGKGLALLLKTNSMQAAAMKKASESGVVFAACQNSMRTRNVKTEDLVTFATQVDSGVAELIRKQEAGWSYVRAGE